MRVATQRTHETREALERAGDPDVRVHLERKLRVSF